MAADAVLKAVRVMRFSPPWGRCVSRVTGQL